MAVVMRKNRLLALFVLILGLILSLGILFQPFVVANIVTPFALFIWLLLRLFVLSIHQKILWGLLVFSACIFLLRSILRERKSLPQYEYAEPNATLKKVDIWRNFITYSPQEDDESDPTRRELKRLLVSLYSSKQQSFTNFKIYESLQQREIPLPEQVYAFLFSGDPAGGSRRSLMKVLRALWTAPKKWIRRWTGREAAEYYRSIDEVLTFMENSLEMKHDHDPNGPYNH
jgi:hypothetical protein